jgi:hypothetical protein
MMKPSSDIPPVGFAPTHRRHYYSERSRAQHRLTPKGPPICCPVCAPITYAREGAKHKKETP